MHVLSLYHATRTKSKSAVLQPTTADRRAYLYLSPSQAVIRACDPDGTEISMRNHEGSLYAVEQQTSAAELGPRGFNALKQRTVHLYRYTYNDAMAPAIDENGVASVGFDFPRGEYVGAFNGFDYVGADAAVAKMVTVEDRASGAYDFLFRPSAEDRANNNGFFNFSFFSLW